MTMDNAMPELERTQQQLRELQRLARLGSWEFDIRTNHVTWTDGLYEIYGLDRATFPATYEGYLERLHPGDRDRVHATIGEALRRGGSFEFEERIVRPDGDVRALLSVGRVLTDASGAPVQMLGVCRDVTTERRAEEQERELVRARAAKDEAEITARRLEFLSRASHTLASSLDYEQTLANVVRLAVPEIADWCAVDIVTDAQDVLRLAAHHVDPAKVSSVLDLTRRFPVRPDAQFGLGKVLRTGEPEWGARATDGVIDGMAVNDEHAHALRLLGMTSFAIVPLLTGGTVVGALTFAQSTSGREFSESDLLLLASVARRAATSIQNARLVRELADAHGQVQRQTEEMEAQAAELEEAMAELELRNQELEEKSEEAEKARAEAERANAAKSQFLANMSHELRTPLNAIGGYAELLELGIHGPVTDAQRSAIDRIRTNQARLLALINDLLNFVKLRAGRLEITLQPVLLNDVVAGLAPIVEPQVQKRGLSLSLMALEQETFVLANRERLEQVLLNLLSNAIKFTQPGGAITVDVEDLDTTVLMHVTDTGCGIAADQIEDIFEPFTQVAQMQVKDNHGAGLGLAISRDLMEGMGGSLDAVSEPGAGSRFTITLARTTRDAAVTDSDQLEAEL